MENTDEIVDDMKGNNKNNVGGGYRKMRQASLKEKGKKPARSLQVFLKNSWMIMKNRLYNLALQR